MQKPIFFLVWREGSDRSTPTFKHSEYPAAAKEAQRLAITHGGTYHVLMSVATAKRVDVTFDEYPPSDIPF